MVIIDVRKYKQNTIFRVILNSYLVFGIFGAPRIRSSSNITRVDWGIDRVRHDLSTRDGTLSGHNQDTETRDSCLLSWPGGILVVRGNSTQSSSRLRLKINI